MSDEVLKLDRDIEIKIPRKGKELIFKMRELSSSDYWAIQTETLKTKKNPDGTETPYFDVELKNKISLAKSITDPPQTVESIGNLPPKITDILIKVFNQIHVADEEDIKKTTTQ